MSFDKAVLVTKKTPLEELLITHGTVSQVSFFLESRGESIEDYKDSHATYQKEVRKVQSLFPSSYRSQKLDRTLLHTHQFGDCDVVVVVGDPGLFVNTAKYVGEQPIMLINPDSQRFADVFTTCRTQDVGKVLKSIQKGSYSVEELTMAQALVDDGQTMYALNDLFIGKRTHQSARYQISTEGRSENHSSSGIIVSTGSGSTGWYTSIMRTAHALTETPQLDPTFARQSDELRYIVREAFPSKVTGTSIVHGSVYHHSPLIVTSHMPEGGVIFSDGIESDYITFGAGKNVRITPAHHKVQRIK